MKINGDVLAELIERDIEDTLKIGVSESSWVIAEIDGFVVEVRISEIGYWMEEENRCIPEINYGYGVAWHE